MGTRSGQSATHIAALDNIVENEEFQESPKALMLLRICQFAQAMRPQVLDHYWSKLKDLQRHMPSDQREGFRILKASIEKPKSESYKGFTREMLDRIGAAFKADGSVVDNAAEIMQDCQAKLEKRWLPFGKKPVWIALVKAWADIDRGTALNLLPRVSHEVRLGVLNQMNTKSPLSTEEWTQAKSKTASVKAVILQILEVDKPVLQLPAELAEMVAKDLRKTIHFKVPNEEQEPQYKDKRQKAQVQYFKLVNCIVGSLPEVTQELLEELFTETVDTDRYKGNWPQKIADLREIINLWVAYPDLRDKANTFIKSEDFGPYRDFAIAHWYGMTVQSGEEAETGLDEVIKECKEKKSAEIWYLATIVRRGLGGVALQLAQASQRSADLLPIVRRAWLLSHPETASSSFSTEDLKDDIIGQFLLLGTFEDRVEYLRELTNNGKRSLPPEFWSKPDITRIASQVRQSEIRDARDFSLMILYARDEKEENYFKQFVRMHGAMLYSYETVDPFLMSTLVVWKEQRPEEVESLLNQMWMVMEPDINLLMTDVLRNNIFDRCQSIFAGSTKCFNNLFVDYVKRRLIDEPIQQHLPNNTVRTLSLKPTVPFWYCLIAAERVAKISAECKEELIEYALTHYEYDEEMVKMAARVFSANKGLSAVFPPVELSPPSCEKSWQMGVVDASTKEILTLLIADAQGDQAQAEAAS